jgi:hypothetical protein
MDYVQTIFTSNRFYKHALVRRCLFFIIIVIITRKLRPTTAIYGDRKAPSPITPKKMMYDVEM